MRASLTAAIAVIALAGCATIITQGDDEIDVDTPGVISADCEVRSLDGALRARVVTPGTIEINKDSRDLEAVCTKDGFAEGRAVVESGFDPWFFGNILAGGLIGMVVDLATGNVNAYDDKVAIYMEPDSERRASFDAGEASTASDASSVRAAADAPISGDAAIYLGFASSREWADNTAEFLWIAESTLLDGVRPVVQQRLDPATGQPRFHIYGAGLDGEDALDICDGLKAASYLCRVVEARG